MSLSPERELITTFTVLYACALKLWQAWHVEVLLHMYGQTHVN